MVENGSEWITASWGAAVRIEILAAIYDAEGFSKLQGMKMVEFVL